MIEYLSGGNHELFHSNVLAYIAQKYPKYFRDLFSHLGINNFEDDFSKNVLREEKHFDFAIRKTNGDTGNEYTLILENKMKSIPDMEQLAEHSKKASADHKILLTMIEVKPENIENGWKQVTYAELAEVMERERDVYKFDSFFEKFLEEYISYVRNLSSKVEEIKKKFEEGKDNLKIKKFLSENDVSPETRKWEKLFLRKVRFQLVADEIKSKYNKPIFCKAGIVRSNVPFIELLPYTKDEIKSEKNKYWIQIYDNHIERGFWLSYDDIKDKKLIKNRPRSRAKKPRIDFFNSLWDISMGIEQFNEIAVMLTKEPFNLTEFSRENKNDQMEDFHGYIYNDATLFYIRTEFNDSTISEFTDKIILELNKVCEILETTKTPNKK